MEQPIESAGLIGAIDFLSGPPSKPTPADVISSGGSPQESIPLGFDGASGASGFACPLVHVFAALSLAALEK